MTNSMATTNARPAIISCNAFTRLCHYDRKYDIEVTQPRLVTSYNPIHHVTTIRRYKKLRMCVRSVHDAVSVEWAYCSRGSAAVPSLNFAMNLMPTFPRPQRNGPSVNTHKSPLSSLLGKYRYICRFADFNFIIYKQFKLCFFWRHNFSFPNLPWPWQHVVSGTPCQLGSTRPWVDSRDATHWVKTNQFYILDAFFVLQVGIFQNVCRFAVYTSNNIEASVIEISAYLSNQICTWKRLDLKLADTPIGTIEGTKDYKHIVRNWRWIIFVFLAGTN